MGAGIVVRAFTDEDYGLLVRLESEVLDDPPATVDQLRHVDAVRDPALLFLRHVVEREGERVA